MKTRIVILAILGLLIFNSNSYSHIDLTISHTESCRGTDIKFSISSSASFSTIKWVFGDGNSQITTTLFTSHKYDTFGSFQVKVSLFDNNNQLLCAPFEKKIVVYNNPIADFDTPEICCCPPAVVRFNNKTIMLGDTITSWRWDFYEGSSTVRYSLLENPIHTYTNIGSFDVRLIATSKHNCKDTMLKESIILILYPKPKFWLFRNGQICTSDTIFAGEQVNVLDSSVYINKWKFNKGDSTFYFDTMRPPNRIFKIKYDNPGIYILSLYAEIRFFCPTYMHGKMITSWSSYGDTSYWNYKNESTFTVVVKKTSGIDDRLSEFRLYPNPVENTLRIHASSDVGNNNIVLIYNAFGQLLKKMENLPVYKNEIQLNTADLKPGFYLLKLKFDNKEFEKTFIKTD